MKTPFLKKKILIPVLAATIFLTTSAFNNDFFEIAKQIEIFTTLFKELNMNYVDETNPADLMDTAIKGMLSDLDPYTNFMNEQDVESARINNTGDYTGIGARVKTFKDKLLIVEPYKEYPADKAGLKAGDEIIKVGNIVVETYKDNAGDLLKGAPDTSVGVTYKRQGKTQTATIKRAEVEINAVPHFSMVNDKTGYIVLSRFNNKAHAETNYALRDLKAQGAERMILDLRGNPGGLLNEAIKIVNLFVPKGQLVVTTKSKVKKYNKTYLTQSEPIDTEIPLVVLIDGGSASASEIVSGALQDLDRAVVVGSRSFGKGLVQRPKQLTYGTQVKITISRYYTPSGRCIQVLPDVIIGPYKKSPITNAILNDGLVFNYATNYYYNHNLSDVNSFKLTDADFNDFKNYLKTNNFSFKTDTEKALYNAFKTATEENLNDNIETDFNTLISNLEQSKSEVIDENKRFLLEALTEEIVKRYAYREGLYDYYKIHDARIKKATEILSDSSAYFDYLR